MDKRQKEDLVRLAGDAIRFDCPMAQYTTLRVGGKAEALYETNDLKDLSRVISYLNEEQIPYLTVGRGSNILVKDAGISGLVILLRGSLAAAKIERADESTVVAGAGLPLVDLLILCRDSGLGGLEFLAGIPGTVGGAVAMNAGAFGREMGTRVKEIKVINRSGEVISKVRSQLKFSYRELEMEKGCVITRVRLNTDPESEKVVAERIAEHLKRRKERQPLEYPSAGSVFKNPQKGHAGKLIENAGLKGKRIGGAMISHKHANFIVNTGSARAKDVLALLYMAQEKVKEETGIQLQPEIQVVGD